MCTGAGGRYSVLTVSGTVCQYPASGPVLLLRVLRDDRQRLEESTARRPPVRPAEIEWLALPVRY